jgi:hypothetical protein
VDNAGLKWTFWPTDERRFPWPETHPNLDKSQGI